MSLNIKTEEGLKKIAGSTLILDNLCADIRSGTFTLTTNTHDGLDSKTINFDSPFPSDDDYVITFNKINGDAVHSIVCSGKSAVGFSIIGSQMNYVNGTSTYEYSCARLITLDGYTDVKRKVENPDLEPIEHSTNFVTSNGIYNALKNVKSIQYNEIPIPSVNWENFILEYIGETTENYINGYFYKCVDHDGTYIWENIQIQAGGDNSIQYDMMPMASAVNFGVIVQYVGATNSVYTHGYFYECIKDNDVYKWIELAVQKKSENVVVYSDTEPDSNDYKDGDIVVYSGENTVNFKRGHHYKLTFAHTYIYGYSFNPSPSSSTILYSNIEGETPTVGTKALDSEYNKDDPWTPNCTIESIDGNTYSIRYAQGTHTDEWYNVTQLMPLVDKGFDTPVWVDICGFDMKKNEIGDGYCLVIN